MEVLRKIENIAKWFLLLGLIDLVAGNQVVFLFRELGKMIADIVF